MKRNTRDTEQRLRRSLGRYGNPPEDQVETQIKRAWQYVLAKSRSPQETSLNATSVRGLGNLWRFRLLAGAAAVVLVVVGGGAIVRDFARTRGANAVAETVDGTLYRVSGEKASSIRKGDGIAFGELIRSGSGGAALVLRDSSRIEMRSNSELVLENANDGVRIRLNDGSVIITAAKQGSGHLYVQTKDVTVSVVGTIFLVNAEKSGSRVAVIQGEVRVQHGKTLKKLLPGEQVATVQTMEAIAVSEEIAWSRESSALQALLQRSQVSAAAPAPLKFATVLIKPLVSSSEGFGLACRGIDGVWSAPWGTYGFGFSGDPASGYPVVAPRGQCVGNGALVALIGFAYGVWAQDVSGGPDWVRPASPGTGSNNGNTYQIEGVAENPATATTDQLKQMMQTMLADRFKLNVRRERKERDGFALVVASGGSRLKEVFANEKLSPWRHDGDRFKGKSTLSELALFLSGRLGAYPPVVDKTGLTGIYEYEVNLPAPRGDTASLISTALENQLGLRLRAEKVPFEALVIDQAEKPSPN
jgi:uncharacterized protein (TIGR03435 family)